MVRNRAIGRRLEEERNGSCGRDLGNRVDGEVRSKLLRRDCGDLRNFFLLYDDGRPECMIDVRVVIGALISFLVVDCRVTRLKLPAYITGS